MIYNKILERNDLKEILKASTKLKTVSKELVSSYKDGYIGKLVYNVTLNDGTTRLCEQIIKDGREGHAVVIIPITQEGNYIMVVQSRPNTKETVALQFPAGMVDDGEDFKEAAQRELLEETGYIADEFYELGWDYQDDGCSQAIITTFVALGCKKKQSKKLDKNERLEEFEIGESVIEELILGDKPLVHDKNSKTAYMEYKLKKRR